MKIAARVLLALYVALASASPVKTVAKDAKGSNLLQKVGCHSGQHPCAGGIFSPESNLAGAVDGIGGGQSPDFFTKDFEKMDELPNYKAQLGSKKQCHPKCRWSCSKTAACNSLCEPRCKAPKCVTACKKISLARCKRVCKDPQCAVVCPPQCEHGTCPKCKTVCGESVCELSCGQSKCESTCADPACTWDCKPNPVCEKPVCKMTCDSAACTFGKDQTLPNDAEVPYMGQEIAWKGLGKIPEEHLAEFAPLEFSKPLLPGGAKPMEGSKPLPAGGLKSINGNQGISQEAVVDGPTRWAGNAPQPNIILAPSRLSTR